MWIFGQKHSNYMEFKFISIHQLLQHLQIKHFIVKVEDTGVSVWGEGQWMQFELVQNFMKRRSTVFSFFKHI